MQNTNLPQLGASTTQGADLPADILNKLPPAEREKAAVFVAEIDPTDPVAMRYYGAAEQGNLASFVDRALPVMLAAPAGDAEKAVGELKHQLTRWDDRVSSGGLVRRLLWALLPDMQLSRLRGAFTRTYPAMEEAANRLFDGKVSLTRLAVQLEQLQKENEARFDRLTAYVALGKVKLKRMAADPRPDGDWKNAQQRLEVRVHDLMLSRQVCLQVAAQIIILLASTRLTEQQLDTTLTSTIPLWKTQAMILLGLKQQEAFDRIGAQAQASIGESAAQGVAEIGRTVKRQRAARLHEENTKLDRSIDTFTASLKGLTNQQQGAKDEILPLRDEAQRATPATTGTQAPA